MKTLHTDIIRSKMTHHIVLTLSPYFKKNFFVLKFICMILMKIMLLASINLLATHSLREDEDSLVSGFFHPLPSIQDPNDEVFDSLFFRNLSSDDYSPPSTDSGPPSLQAQDGPLPTPAQTRKIAQSIQDAIQDTHPPAAPNDLTAVSDTNEWSWEWISHQNHGHTQKHIHDFQGITIHDRILAENMLLHQK